MAGNARAVYEQWFQAADKDKSGFLTTKELKKALKTKGYKIGRKQFKEQFRQFDRDGDKKITLQEYLLCMGAIPEANHKEAAVRKAFEKADKNRDGTLNIAEVNLVFQEMGGYLSPDELFKIVNEIDKDKSGQINYKEFMAYFSKHQGLMDSGSSDDEWD